MCEIPKAKFDSFKVLLSLASEIENVQDNIKANAQNRKPEQNCPFGFVFNRETNICQDKDECALGIHNCDLSSICVNMNGTYGCIYQPCEIGYMRHSNGSCVEVTCPEGQKYDSFFDRCENIEPIRPNKTRIGCGPGSTPVDDICVDIDECRENMHNCSDDEKCVNRLYGFDCVCKYGFERNMTTKICEDVNECRMAPCHWPFICINTVGSYSCECDDGFTYRNGHCSDNNECEDENVCRNGYCVNSIGSYECECDDGFKKDENNFCVDIDECASGNVDFCELCENTIGSFKCNKCLPGFENDGNFCKDIDECSINKTICGSNSLCTNLIGDFRCTRIVCESNYFKIEHETSVCMKKSLEKNIAEPFQIEYRAIQMPNNQFIPEGGVNILSLRSEDFPCEYNVHLDSRKSIKENVELSKKEDWYLTIYDKTDARLRLRNSLDGPQDIVIRIDCNYFNIKIRRTLVFVYVSKYASRTPIIKPKFPLWLF
ncbi:fibulin-1-like protein, partial [Dinothrombium tinctorium]